VRRNAVGNLSLGGGSLKASYIQLPFFFLSNVIHIYRRTSHLFEVLGFAYSVILSYLLLMIAFAPCT
jgi:hypothetical protein